MWAAKLPGEGAALYDAAVAMNDMMLELGIAVDGGKDSISMAARAPDGRRAATRRSRHRASLVISAYVTCPDVTQTVTSRPQAPGSGRLLYVDLGGGRHRLGGSALAHVFGQIGDEVPDVDDVELLRRAFEAVQEELLADGGVAAGHDRSDGGLVDHAARDGLRRQLRDRRRARPGAGVDAIAALFAEELGLVLEVAEQDVDAVRSRPSPSASVPCAEIGRATKASDVRIRYGDAVVLEARHARSARPLGGDELPARPAAGEPGLRRRRSSAGSARARRPRFVVPYTPVDRRLPRLLEQTTSRRSPSSARRAATATGR